MRQTSHNGGGAPIPLTGGPATTEWEVPKNFETKILWNHAIGCIQRLQEAMSGENRRLVADEPVEVQDVRKFTNQFRGIYRM